MKTDHLYVHLVRVMNLRVLYKCVLSENINKFKKKNFMERFLLN